ncbi:MAG: NADH-quinone oxidoreductase subunit NuoK [Myxococcales bacterium]|nr:MAG: NADH-quinone oxidoreductase subunit NuoK [Myxococcales bacterium]
MNWLTEITLNHYLALSVLLFTMGIVGVILRKNALIVFMCIELMLNAVNLAFIAFALKNGNELGHVFVFFVMTVAAAEAAVGLAIFVALFRNKQTVYIDEATELKN